MLKFFLGCFVGVAIFFLVGRNDGEDLDSQQLDKLHEQLQQVRIDLAAIRTELTGFRSECSNTETALEQLKSPKESTLTGSVIDKPEGLPNMLDGPVGLDVI